MKGRRAYSGGLDQSFPLFAGEMGGSGALEMALDFGS